jgi:hypothetical protein
MSLYTKAVYVVDSRIRFDVSWAVSAANTRYSEQAAIELAKEWATRSGKTYYVHRLAGAVTAWQPVAMVTP